MVTMKVKGQNWPSWYKEMGCCELLNCKVYGILTCGCTGMHGNGLSIYVWSSHIVEMSETKGTGIESLFFVIMSVQNMSKWLYIKNLNHHSHVGIINVCHIYKSQMSIKFIIKEVCEVGYQLNCSGFMYTWLIQGGLT